MNKKEGEELEKLLHECANKLYWGLPGSADDVHAFVSELCDDYYKEGYRVGREEGLNNH